MVDKPDKRRYGLTTHVMAGALLIHLVLLPVLYTNISDTFRSSAEEQFIVNAREISGLLADMFSVVNLSDNLEDLKSFMDFALLSGEILFIEIENEQGTIIRSRDSTSVTSADFIEDSYIGHHDDDVYFMSIPLSLTIEGIGYSTLKLGFDETVVLEKLETVNQRSLIILGLYFVTILLLMGFFTKVITQPLRTLRDWSRDVAKGETDNEVKVATYIKEVDSLSNDLERMRLSLVELAERMHYKAMHDELTGLPNRTLNDDRLDQAVTRATRENSSFAVLLLDLDRFKDINDTLGHGIGDEVLRIVAARLNSVIRESDTISRIGGDEFCAIIEGTERVVAENIALKIANAIEPPFEINGHTLQVGTSIGIAVFPDDGMSPELLIQHADVAMYEAKYKGLKVASYHEDMDKHRFEDMQLSVELRDGITSGQFEAVFQPKIDLRSGMPCGCELLTQWRHPRLGIISPEKFIPLAERENLIGKLTLREGRYKAYGQQLQIERGELIFNGPLNNPQLDIRAVRRAQDVVAGIQLSGTPSQLRSNVFSEPPLSDPEALSYLLTGRPLASATSAGDGDMLNNAAFALGLSGAGSITSQIRSELGLDTLAVEGGAEDGRIIAGKRFGDRLLVEYGYGLIDRLGTLLLRYQLNNRLVLESRTGTVSNLDILYSVKKK